MSSKLAPLHDQFLKAGQFLRNWSKATLRTYEQGLRRLDMEKPSKPDLEAWVVRLREEGLTPGGVNMYARAVNSYLTWLHEEGHVEQRLRVKLLKAPLRQHALLSDVEVRALLHFRPRSVAQRRTHTLILLLLDTGVRISEALTLERAKVNLNDQLVTVFGKGAKERTVPFSLELRPILFKWLTAQNANGPLVFASRHGGRLSYRNTFRDIQVLCRAAGVKTYVHPHGFRHQFAGHFIKRGGDLYRLSRLLGHTSVQTTAIYLRSLNVEDLRVRLTPLSTVG